MTSQCTGEKWYSATTEVRSTARALATVRERSLLNDHDVDPDDPDMRLVLSMGVVVDGVVKHPKGLHADDSKKVKAQNLDRTIETEEEKEKEGEQGKKKRRKRNFGPNWPNWPNGIVPYVFDSSILANRKYFLQAAELFHNLTCIRWKPRSSEVEAEVGHKGYTLVRSGTSCSAGVGFYGDGEHIINLKEPGCGTVGVAAHEMLHRLGQRHEQSRSDRDRYVQIRWDRIDPDSQYNYYRRLTYNRNPYDIGSVMQYGYGEGRGIELRDKNLLFLEFPGNEVLSFYDIKDVLDQYDCTTHCTSPPDCQNEGYVNVECTCTCPVGFTGTNCDTIITDPDCGGFIHLKENDPSLERDSDVTVISPNYPGQVGQDKICRWAITAPAGYIIKMTIDDLHMAYNPDTLRCYHWLEIQYNLPGQPGVRDNPCVYGVCVPTEAKACQYKCVCQSGYTGEKCDQVIEDAKLKCTFERFEKCFFDNVQQGDDFEWGQGFKHTISKETGPEKAFRGERFLFAEMSLPRVPGDKAILQTTVPLPAKAGCLSFAYNMFGRTVNKLSLYAEGPGSGREVLWSKEGNQGSDWLTETVDVTATEGMKLSFEAITGESWDSDVALDEITWEVGSCRDDIFSDCVVAGEEYTGTRDYTRKGVTCQAWSSNTPHKISSVPAVINFPKSTVRFNDLK
uniref:Metalloendopeptidase n=1 Tax=Magallana gigas TaxID=29159 RepID=K1QWZ9_MAGGI